MLMKKIIIWAIGIISITLIIYMIIVNPFSDEYKVKNKFKEIGYSDNEISEIMKVIPEEDYNIILKRNYNDSLIDIIAASGFKEEKLNEYLDYYEKNSENDIDNIITIVNSDYDLANYPASSLLAKLVNEKYYIDKNVARYLDYGNTHEVSTSKIVSLVNANVDLGFYNYTKETNLNDGNLVLVNKFYYLSGDYEPDDLVSLSGQYNGGVNNKMRKEAAQAFMRMVDAAILDNIIIKNSSAYRSYDYQVKLYDNYVKRDGKDAADIYSARAGFSEHQTGLCADINEIDSSFEGTEESKWLINNAYKYGFILRFPKGKEDITGYKYEPWHYRYVGQEAAKVIYENDLTLEEYYAYYVDNN